MQRAVMNCLAAPLIGAGFGVGIVAGAFAADLFPATQVPVYTKAPVVAPFSWTGLYIGANAGYSWNKINTTSSADCLVGGYFCDPTIPATLAAASAISADGSGSFVRG